ncbi:MAG: cyanophycinase [Pseudomonadota bacterium]
MLPASLAVQAAPVPPPKGSLVIIGGNLRAENADVWQRVVQLAGGPGARIAVFPSASADPARSGEIIVGRLNEYGANSFLVPLAVKLEGSDFRKLAEDPALAASVRAAGGVFFAGGDQARITQVLVREDGKRSAVLDAVWDVYSRGGVVAGSSAGAAIMSSTMFYAPQTVFGTLRMGVTDGREIAPGLGFIGDDVFIDQHLLVRGRFARMIPAMLKKGYKLGLGIDENTAMVVDNRRRVEIVGHKGALLIDLTRATTDASSAGFNVSNVAISYLDRGDRYDLATRTFIPSPDKAASLPGDGAGQPLFSSNILGSNAVVELMEQLVNNRQQQAIGIATGGAGDSLPALGFEFKFSKTPDSSAYVSRARDAYSILNMRLDIRPIEVPQAHDYK